MGSGRGRSINRRHSRDRGFCTELEVSSFGGGDWGLAPAVQGCLEAGLLLCALLLLDREWVNGADPMGYLFPGGAHPIPADGKVNEGRSPEVCPAQG